MSGANTIGRFVGQSPPEDCEPEESNPLAELMQKLQAAKEMFDHIKSLVETFSPKDEGEGGAAGEGGGDGEDDIVALERAAVVEGEPTVIDVVHTDVHDGVDPFLLEEHLEQPLPVGQPTDTEVAEKRLWRHIGHGGLLLQPRLAQLVGEVEQVLVGSTEAAGALCGTDDDRARLL